MTLFKSMIVTLSFILLAGNSYAMQKCISGGVVSAIEIGQLSDIGPNCPDDGNCIYFEYKEYGNKNKQQHFVERLTNLNDGGKGRAMYDMLKTSLLTGVLFS
ncbi:MULTISPECIES: hypothetical protein [Pseudomonadota]|uniref:hypothetical protein n=1 Tax=Pseudomonadota TaxID=1224 RepID=UPI001BFC923E|nr:MULTISPECIES: hypothetical protein [Pseudomonadota]